MAEITTSRGEYEAAAARFEAASAADRERRPALLAQLHALDDEYAAAAADLCRHEAFGGIPLWSHPKHEGCPAWQGTGRCRGAGEARS
jgi:hypothetical protein